MSDYGILARDQEEVEHLREEIAKINPELVQTIRIEDGSHAEKGYRLPLVYNASSFYEGEEAVTHFLSDLESAYK